MRAEEFFAGEWQQELPRLRRLLTRNGISPDDVEDVLQESAVRLFAAWGRVFDGRPLRPLITTVVLNASRDHLRRREHAAWPVAYIPEDHARESLDLDRVVMARFEVAKTAHAMATLSPDCRRVLQEAVGDELGGEEVGRHRAPASIRMARTRARRRLRTALELLGAATGALAAGTRRVGRSHPAQAGAALAAVAYLLSAPNISLAAPSSREPVELSGSRPGEAENLGVAVVPKAQTSHLVVVGAEWSADIGSVFWSDRPAPLLGVGGFGAQASVGGGGTQNSCTYEFLRRITVEVRCKP